MNRRGLGINIKLNNKDELEKILLKLQSSITEVNHAINDLNKFEFEITLGNITEIEDYS